MSVAKSILSSSYAWCLGHTNHSNYSKPHQLSLPKNYGKVASSAVMLNYWEHMWVCWHYVKDLKPHWDA